MLPEIQAHPDCPDHPVFLWNPSGGSIVSPMEADFCAQTGLTVEEAYGAEPPSPSQPTEVPTLHLHLPAAATSPENAGEDVIVYKPEPTEEDSFPPIEDDEFTINFMALPCQPSHID